MGRKKKFDITTNIRFKLKAYRVVSGSVPPELAMQYADAVTQQFDIGFGEYRKIRETVMESDVFREIPSALRGLYLGFVNEYVKRVFRQGTATSEELVNKWARLGLDAGILQALVEVLEKGHSASLTPKPAK